MTSTFFGLEIGKRSLFAQQAGLNTVGQNIANVNTPGYSRQRVNFTATDSQYYPGLEKSAGAGQMGTGVVAKSIERVREEFLDVQFRNENQAGGAWDMRLDTLDKIQAVLNEPSDTGITNVLNNFLNSWQDLSREPDNLTARSVVKQRMIELTETFHNLNTKLTQLDGDISDSVNAKVSEFNSDLGQIQELNKQINTLETLGDKANDLRDKRDYLVDQLSRMANVTAKETSNGYQVSIGSNMLVDDVQAPNLISYDATSNSFNIPIDNGELQGLTYSRSQYVKVYQDQLDALANGLVNGKVQGTLPNDYTFQSGETTMPFDATLPDGTTLKKGDPIPAGGVLPKETVATFEGLNGIHKFGFINDDPLTKAGNLFETIDGSTTFTAKNIIIAKNIDADVRNIASSAGFRTVPATPPATSTSTVKRGNGDIALIMGQLNAAKIDFKDGLPPNSAILTTGTYAEYMRSMVGQLGVQGQQAKNQVSNQDALINQVDQRRQSVSGVSLDEEMSNMIKFQQGYAAAARVVTTIDQLLDTLVNRMAAH